MSEWVSYVLVFVAGIALGKLFGGSRAAGPSLPQAPPPALTPDVESRVRELMLSGRKIDAIKAYREGTGVGLKEAKERVEELQRRSGPG